MSTERCPWANQSCIDTCPFISGLTTENEKAAQEIQAIREEAANINNQKKRDSMMWRVGSLIERQRLNRRSIWEAQVFCETGPITVKRFKVVGRKILRCASRVQNPYGYVGPTGRTEYGWTRSDFLDLPEPPATD